MKSLTVLDAKEIAAGDFAESDVIDLSYYATFGFFSLQLYVTGDGTGKFEYETSNDGKKFITQTATADQIVIDFTKTSGPASNGEDLISFEPEPTKYIKIKATETGGISTITVTAILFVA
jgi:hypothetical protein